MEIQYLPQVKKPEDIIDLYKALEWYQLSGYTDEDIEKANASFYSVYAYDGDTLVGLGRVASDGLIAAIMSGICVRSDYRRHGIGAEIVNRIVEYCQSGLYKLNVQIFCEDSLIKWYEGMGFEKMPVGMRKPMPHSEEKCALKKNFGDIYGIEQLTELSEDFYWYDFDAFGDFSYYSGMGSEGVKVPFLRMTFFSNEPVKFSAELIFENVSEFEIGCIGVRTPLFGFDIICTEKYGYSERKRFKIRSLEDDDISFFCEKFRVMSVSVAENRTRISCPERQMKVDSIDRIMSEAAAYEVYDEAEGYAEVAAYEPVPEEYDQVPEEEFEDTSGEYEDTPEEEYEDTSEEYEDTPEEEYEDTSGEYEDTPEEEFEDTSGEYEDTPEEEFEDTSGEYEDIPEEEYEDTSGEYEDPPEQEDDVDTEETEEVYIEYEEKPEKYPRRRYPEGGDSGITMDSIRLNDILKAEKEIDELLGRIQK